MIRKVNNARTDLCRAYFCKLILFELADFKVWVAGGAIRAYFAREPINDIDLYFTSKKQCEEAANFILGKDDAEVVFENDNVTKIFFKGRVFDFCKHYYKTPNETLNSFDFTICQGAVDLTNTYVGDFFFIDLSAKRLKLHKVPAPMSSLIRFQKYITKGYSMGKEDLIKLTKTLQKIQIDDETGEAKNCTSDSGKWAKTKVGSYTLTHST